MGSAALNGRKKGDFVAVLELVIAGLIIDADGGEDRFAHGAELWKTAAQFVQEFTESLSGTDRLDQLGAAGQVFKVGIKLDLYVHGLATIQASPSLDGSAE